MAYEQCNVFYAIQPGSVLDLFYSFQGPQCANTTLHVMEYGQ